MKIRRGFVEARLDGVINGWAYFVVEPGLMGMSRTSDG